MANRYERVAALGIPDARGNCPVSIDAGALLSDAKTGGLVCQLKLRNASDRVASSVRVRVKLLERGVEINEATHVYTAFACPGEQFGQDIAFDVGSLGPDAFEVECVCITFADGGSWSLKLEEPRAESVVSTEAGEASVGDEEAVAQAVVVQDPKKTGPIKNGKVILAICAVAAVVLIVLLLLPKSSSSKWPNTIHVPEMAEVQDRLSSSGSNGIELKKDADSDFDKYIISADGEETGELYFNAGSSEDVGLYVDDKVDDWKQVFDRCAHAILASVDPDLQTSDADDWIRSAISLGKDGKLTHINNGVNYKFVVAFDDTRLILRVVVPDDVEGSESSSKKTAPVTLNSESSNASSSNSSGSSSSGSVASGPVPSAADFRSAASTLKLSYQFKDADDGDYAVYSGATLIGMVKLANDGVTVLVDATDSDSETWMAGMMMTTVSACEPSLGINGIRERATDLLDSSSLEENGLSYSMGTAGSDYYFITVTFS